MLLFPNEAQEPQNGFGYFDQSIRNQRSYLQGQWISVVFETPHFSFRELFTLVTYSRSNHTQLMPSSPACPRPAELAIFVPSTPECCKELLYLLQQELTCVPYTTRLQCLKRRNRALWSWSQALTGSSVKGTHKRCDQWLFACIHFEGNFIFQKKTRPWINKLYQQVL